MSVATWLRVDTYLTACGCPIGCVWMATLLRVNGYLASCGCLLGCVWMATWLRVDGYMAACEGALKMAMRGFPQLWHVGLQV